MTQSQDTSAPFFIRAQYLKDLSFEHPDALQQFTAQENAEPTISVNIQAKAQAVGERIFEVTLDVDIHAKREDKTVFLVQLTYAGLVEIGDVADAMVGILLMVHAPSLLFPFVRNLVADITRDGGFQPLFLQPVNFAALYQQQQEETKH